MQPFVENSIIHGFEKMDGGGLLNLYGGIEDGKCSFFIRDNGKGMTEEDICRARNTDNENIGIKNIDKKIKLLFGEEYGVKIKSEVGKGTLIELTMPFQTIE